MRSCPFTICFSKTICPRATSKRSKKIAVDLLTQIKDKIATLDHWRDKEDTRSAVNNLIRDSLFVSLPESYDDQSINRYTGLIYEHVYNRYPAIVR